MLNLSALPLTDKEMRALPIGDWVVHGDKGVIADAQRAKVLEGVQVWLESYEDPFIKGMGQWLREQLAASIPKEEPDGAY